MPSPSLITLLILILTSPMTILSFITSSPSSLPLARRTFTSTIAFTAQQQTQKQQNLQMSSSSSSSSIEGKNLLSIKECLSLQSDSNTIFVDGSWHLDKSRNGREEYEKGPRIKGAKYFDIDDVSSKTRELNPKGLPHMMPTKKLFAAAMDALQIQNSNHIIVYGTQGSTMFTARTWYTFVSMGHDAKRVHLMQGSLQQWMEEGGAVEEEECKVPFWADDLDLEVKQKTKYVARDAANFVNMDDVLKVVVKNSNDDNDDDDKDTIIIDTRPAGRFYAEVPEPREGVRGGHMPGSINVPFLDLLDPSSENTKLKPKDELKKVFKDAGINVEEENDKKKIICSCGSGVLACLVAAALEECGRDPKDTFVYDGSWTEWGLDPDAPITK